MEESATIQNRIDLLERLEQEVKVAKQALKSELESDERYVEENLQAKEAMARKKKAKDDVLSRESCQKLLGDIKANNEEITILREILATELMDIYQERKTNEIEDAQGDLRKFILSVKILPKHVKSFKK